MATCPAWLHYSHTVDPKSHWRGQSINQAGNGIRVYLSVCVKSCKLRLQMPKYSNKHLQYRFTVYYMTGTSSVRPIYIGYILDPMCDIILHFLNQPLEFSTYKFRFIIFRLALFLWLLYTWTFRYYRQIQNNHVLNMEH